MHIVLHASALEYILVFLKKIFFPSHVNRLDMGALYSYPWKQEAPHHRCQRGPFRPPELTVPLTGHDVVRASIVINIGPIMEVAHPATCLHSQLLTVNSRGREQTSVAPVPMSITGLNHINSTKVDTFYTVSNRFQQDPTLNQVVKSNKMIHS